MKLSFSFHALLLCLLAALLAKNAPAEDNTGELVPVTVTPKPLHVASHYYEKYYDQAIILSFDQGYNTPFTEFDAALVECNPAPTKQLRILHDYGSTYRIPVDLDPGTDFRIVLKAGFPAKNAPYQLPMDYYISGRVPDLPTQASLVTDGVFFPLHAPIWELPLRSVNFQQKLQVKVYELYDSTILNALSGLDESYYSSSSDRWAHLTAEAEIEVPAPKNQAVFSSLDLNAIGIPRDRPGLYNIEMAAPKERWSSDNQSKFIVITDLALFATVQDGEYLCQVRSLARPEQPVPAVELTLWSRKNQELAKATTDAAGEARLLLPPMEDKSDYPKLLLARNPSTHDVSYLLFDSAGTDARFRKRRTLSNATKPAAFLFADRGAALPGEEVTFTALLRNPRENRPLPGVPLELKLYDSRNNLAGSKFATTDSFGVLQATFQLDQQAPLGNYEVRLVQPGTTICYTFTFFLVADFTPDQLAARATLPETIAADEETLEVQVQADYYFGAPVRDSNVEVSLSSQFAAINPPQELKEFSFGIEKLPRQAGFPTRAIGKTDDNGHLALKVKRPYPARDEAELVLPIQVTAQATVKPTGARAVTALDSRRVDPFDRYLGSRIAKREASRVQLQFAAVDAENRIATLPEKLNLAISRLTWDYLLKEQSDGTYRRTWEQVETAVPLEAPEPDGEGCLWLELPGHGNYKVTVKDENGRTLNQFSFWFYNGESDERSPNPNRMDFKFDQESYQPGQIAKLTFETDFDGECLVVAGSHFMPLTTFAQNVQTGDNTIEIKIPETLCQTNWFVGVTAVGAATADANGKPADPRHLTGLARLSVNQRSHRLETTLEAPELARPGKNVEVRLTIKDADGKPVSGEAAVWGVDEGILALTGFQTPDAFSHFFASQNCPFAQSDLYPALYPMLRVVNGKVGGGFAAAAANRATADFSDYQQKFQEVKELPHFKQLGILKTNEDGSASANLKLPDFAGKLRLMAVATDATCRLGSTQRHIVMHDPVTLNFVAPRTIAPGDRILLRGTIFNQDLEDARLTWSFGRELEGFRPETGEVTLAKGASAEIRFELALPEDTAEGPLPILLKVKTDGGELFEKRMVMTVRSHIPPRPVCDTDVLKPGETLAVKLTGKATDSLRIGSPVARLMGHWDWLNEYPYGCVEQITARAFPQLAIPDLIATGRLAETLREGAAQRVKDTLARYHAYTGSNGWYTMWPNSSPENVWQEGSLFAFLFQAEAARLGYCTVDQAQRDARINTLRIYINDRTKPQEERAIATYALALMAPTFAQPYVAQLTDSTEPCRPYTAFLCAMTLIRCGFADEGARLWATVADQEFTRTDADSIALDSPVRRTGLALWLLADLLPEDQMLPKLAATLDDLAGDDQYFTTQEHAWYALGLSKYLLTLPKLAGESRLAATLASEEHGVKTLDFAGEKPITYSESGSYVICNTGTEPLIVQHAYRASAHGITPVSAGLHISRVYQNEAGEIVDSCKVGDLLTVKIILSGATATNLVLSDLLPAGFEIEDEKLMTRAGKTSEQSSNGMNATLVEKRFDRLLWFGNLYNIANLPGIFTYQVRAVAPGTFQVPPVQIEAMYKPQLRAIGAPDTPVFTVTE
ncbi:MAG: hypothetical protein J6Y80_00135 [Victivallales bacterium]|nr:hypothetical protein [Victivallales bacterium]